MNVKKILLSGNKYDFSLSQNDSLILKGFAICAMLCHHLFSFPEYSGVVSALAGIGKICVSIFLFISAYGLTIQYEKLQREHILQNTLIFEIKRYIKFYFNYWFIFLIWVPIGIFGFNIGLNERYNDGNMLNILGKIIFLITDFLGFNGTHSYNITWWFNKLIIVLYFLFPVLFWMLKKVKYAVFLMSSWIIVSSYIPAILPTINAANNVYFLIFIIGIWMALNRDKIQSFLSKFNSYILCFIILFNIVIFILIRLQQTSFTIKLIVDAFLTISFVLSAVYIRSLKVLSFLFSFLGKHSMNIYMVHSFIFYYFFKDFIYSFHYPILIFSVLLLICIGISIILEFAKKQIGYYSLMNKTITKLSSLKLVK